MSLADAAAALIVLGLTAYAVLGGADFGTGVWDLTAGRGAAGRARCAACIERSMGPVWEANHVWLIFVLVVVLDGVPGRVRLGRLHALRPALPGGGRASSCAGRPSRPGASRGAGARRGATDVLFALSSVLTPFFLGAAVGGVASGRVPVGNAPETR